MKIEYFQDPGHGWLCVPLTIVQSWGIRPSRFSYLDSANVYLEEDCDAALFLDTARSKGVEVEIVERHQDGKSWIRSLERFR